MKQSDLNYFSGYSVDFYPVAQPDSVFPHQYKPAQEAHDKILQRHGETRAG